MTDVQPVLTLTWCRTIGRGNLVECQHLGQNTSIDVVALACTLRDDFQFAGMRQDHAL